MPLTTLADTRHIVVEEKYVFFLIHSYPYIVIAFTYLRDVFAK